MAYNATKERVYIRFEGPTTRDYLLLPGKNILALSLGRYTYQYTACGIQRTGKLDTRLTRVLKIQPCKTTKIIIKNFTCSESPGSALILRLTGPVNYTFSITQPVEKYPVQQGIYQYTIYGCGQQISSGTVKFTTAQYRWTIHCPPKK